MKRKADGQLDLIALHSLQAEPALVAKFPATPAQPEAKPQQVLVSKRDGTTESFNKARIAVAIESAFKAVRDIPADEPMSAAMNEVVGRLTEVISKNLLERAAHGGSLDVEYIQDSVENQLMCDGHLPEARRFILYREDRRKVRQQKAQAEPVSEPPPAAQVDNKPGTESLLKVIYSEAIPSAPGTSDFAAVHGRNFSYAIQDAVHNDQLAQELLMFDLEHLASALRPERDRLIASEGLEWLYGNCFVRDRDRCVETPQYFWMRLAMALAVNETEDNEARVLEFYETLSTLRFIPSERLLRTIGRSKAVTGRRSLLEDDVESGLTVAGHVNLAAHVESGVLDELLLYGTISSSVRWLDNAVEGSHYEFNIAAQRAREYRDIALGAVGFGKALELSGIDSESAAADEFLDRVAESVAYYATLASAQLAAERGCFPAHEGSNWMLGTLPFESMKISHGEGGGSGHLSYSKDWIAVRAAIRQHGMRNGQLLALTPAHIVEKLIDDSGKKALFATQLNRAARCRKWIDGPVWMSVPQPVTGPELEEADSMARRLGVRLFTPPVRVTLSEPLIDAAAASKVLKGIEKAA